MLHKRRLELISIHTPTRGVTDQQSDRFCMTEISIHTPTRGVTIRLLIRQQTFLYFNPHSHKGSDALLQCFIKFFKYFNPHSHKGSDRVCNFRIHFTKYFNPHSHKGSDRVRRFHIVQFCYFNPHSHKGSDADNTSEQLDEMGFQSTLPQGE